MTVSELIEWLKTQDQTARVDVLTTTAKGYGIIAEFKPFTPEMSYYNDRGPYIELGEDN